MVTRAVSRSGQPLDLTAREFDLRVFTPAYQGRVVSRARCWRHEILEGNRPPLRLSTTSSTFISADFAESDDPFAKSCCTPCEEWFRAREEAP